MEQALKKAASKKRGRQYSPEEQSPAVKPATERTAIFLGSIVATVFKLVVRRAFTADEREADFVLAYTHSAHDDRLRTPLRGVALCVRDRSYVALLFQFLVLFLRHQNNQHADCAVQQWCAVADSSFCWSAGH